MDLTKGSCEVHAWRKEEGRRKEGGRKEEGGEKRAPNKAWPYKASLINWN